jgi:hypothetical protein
VNTVYFNDFAHLDDLQSNIANAKIAANFLKKDIYIRPHITLNCAQKGEKKTNQEYGIGGINILADLKTMKDNSNSFFQSRVKSANRQGCKYVIMNIDSCKGDAKLLDGKVRFSLFKKEGEVWHPINRNVQKIVIIRDKKVIQITRKQVEKWNFADLEKLN